MGKLTKPTETMPTGPPRRVPLPPGAGDLDAPGAWRLLHPYKQVLGIPMPLVWRPGQEGAPGGDGFDAALWWAPARVVLARRYGHGLVYPRLRWNPHAGGCLEWDGKVVAPAGPKTTIPLFVDQWDNAWARLDRLAAWLGLVAVRAPVATPGDPERRNILLTAPLAPGDVRRQTA